MRLAADYLGMTIGLAALILVFSLSTEHFFSATTSHTIANQIPTAVLIATGMTCVLIIAQIDLSVGSVLGLCSAVLGVALTQWRWPLWLAVTSLWIACFILTYTFPMLNGTLGPAGTFWLYAAICVAGFVFIKFKLPETKGRTLEEIERELVD